MQTAELVLVFMVAALGAGIFTSAGLDMWVNRATPSSKMEIDDDIIQWFKKFVLDHYGYDLNTPEGRNQTRARETEIFLAMEEAFRKEHGQDLGRLGAYAVEEEFARLVRRLGEARVYGSAKLERELEAAVERMKNEILHRHRLLLYDGYINDKFMAGLDGGQKPQVNSDGIVVLVDDEKSANENEET